MYINKKENQLYRRHGDKNPENRQHRKLYGCIK